MPTTSNGGMMNNNPFITLWGAWVQGRDITPAVMRELLPNLSHDAYERTWDRWIAFLDIEPTKKTPRPADEIARELLTEVTRPEDFAAFDAVPDRAMKESIWRSLPEDEKRRLYPIITAYKASHGT